MSTITKRELAQVLSEKLGCPMSRARQLVDAFFESLTETLSQGDRIEARGFGASTVKETKPRNARNPKTGKQVFLPARRKVAFKPGRILKQALSQPLETGARQ